MQREEVLVAALRAAAKEILRYDPAKVKTAVKSTAGDLVTTADLGSEEVIVATVKVAFPDDIVISEETTAGHDALTESNLSQITAWVVDPIDGTNNFKHGMAYSGISIGYVEAGEPVLGGILDPYRDLLYLAKRGSGATCNHKPIHVSAVSTFDAGTRVCTSNSPVKGGTWANLARYQQLGDVWVDVLGSAVLIMADVASGKLDLYHHNALKPWDNAAGFLIVAEAGAEIVGLQGQPVDWLTSEVVMGNPQLVRSFVEQTNARPRVAAH